MFGNFIQRDDLKTSEQELAIANIASAQYCTEGDYYAFEEKGLFGNIFLPVSFSILRTCAFSCEQDISEYLSVASADHFS
jgi:hypothetical protein